MKKISIIIPVYNVEDYLETCIESVLNQTYKAFEIILIDDGSTDKSGIICDRLAEEYPQDIVAVHQNNLGPLPARMAGINIASGEVLVFLDADDSLRMDALEIISNCDTLYNYDMLLFDTGDCADYPTIKTMHSLPAGLVYQGETKKSLYQMLISYQIPNSVGLKAIKRDKIQNTDYFKQFFPVKHGEDLLMSAYSISKCERIVYIDQGIYHYRNRVGSAIHSFNSKRKESIKMVHTELEKYIDLWEMPELKPMHNARKVKGWMENLIILFRNKKQMSLNEYKEQLNSMAKDSYFRTAYVNMDKSCVQLKYRLLAWLLYYGYRWLGRI